MIVTLVVGIAQNGVIGSDGGLPWRLSTDLKRFKATTMGKPILMGRKTWDSLPKRPLPGRHNIVITRDRAFEADGASVANSVDEALAAARRDGASEACVIGGGEIYRLTMPFADRLDVTHVLGEVEGDTVFPPIENDEWRLIAEQDHPAGERDTHPTRHAIYERRKD